MAKSKKELLAGRSKVGRPSLRRQVVSDPTTEAAVVQRVADNPPAPSPAPSTSKASTTESGLANASPAAAPKKSRPATAKKAKPKAAPAKAKTKADKPAAKEPFMRMTFDVPKSLHLKLKMQTLKNGTTIKAHMLRIIEESIE